MSKIIDWNLINDVRDNISYPIRKYGGLDGIGYVLASLKSGTVCNVKESDYSTIVNLNVVYNGIVGQMFGRFNTDVQQYDFYFDFGEKYKRSEFLLRLIIEDIEIFNTSDFDVFEQYILELISPIAYMLEYATFDSFYHGKMVNDAKSEMRRMLDVEDIKAWVEQ